MKFRKKQAKKAFFWHFLDNFLEHILWYLFYATKSKLLDEVFF